MKQALRIGLLVIAVAVAGCGQKAKEIVKGPDGTNSNNNSSHNSNDKLDIITDTSVCEKPASSPPTLFRSWSFDLKQNNGLTLHHIWTFKAHSVVNRLICKANGLSVPAEVEVGASIGGNRIQILQSQHLENSIEDGTTEITCPNGMTKGDAWTYFFQGPCLKLRDAKGELLMVPELNSYLEENLMPTEEEGNTL